MTQPDPIDTVFALIARQASIAPDAIALIDEDGAQLSYGVLADQVAALADDLVGAADSPPGTRPRIGIVLPNGPDLSVALLAATIAGEATPFNPRLTSAEFERYFAATKIDILLVDADDKGAAAVAGAVGLPVFRLSFARRILGVGAGQVVRRTAQPKASDIAVVLMTSGSTGVPKIVPLSHRNVCASAMDVAGSVALTSADRCLLMWQQFHIGGLVDLLLAPLSVGSALIVTPGFNEAKFFALTEQLQPTWFQGVPTTLGALAQYAERHDLDPRGTSLRFVRSVAASLTGDLQTRLSELFALPIVRTFGMTEASPLITTTALPPALDKPGSVGRPCGPEVRVFGPDMSEMVAGQTGEIAIRGPNVFAGYEDNAEANATAFRDGWFFTGDNGYLDSDGDLFLAGRAKEQINRGGYKIMPSEVEDVLSRHPTVHEVAVFGVSHPTLGEDIAAAVSLKPGGAIDTPNLRAYLSEQLAANKVPGRITILAELPRNPVGKIDRLALAQTAAAEADTDALLSPPRDAMERFIAGLWARELSLRVVGIHQDFMTVGGDSLSQLRILVAMETAFGCPVPDEVMVNFTTIEDVADALTKAGFVPNDTDGSDANRIAERALDGTAVGIEGGMTLNVFLPAVRDATSASELKIAFEGLTVYTTPGEVRSVLRDTDVDHVGLAASAPSRFLLRRRFRRDAEQVLQEIESEGMMADGWQRDDLSASSSHYFDPDHPVANKTLLVGFTGKLLRLQLPTYRVLLHLDPARFELFLLRDPAQTLFFDGVPGMGNTLMKLGAWLDDFATTGGYARRIAFGTSGGGLAAIHTALSYGWERAVVACPPSLSVHRDLGELLCVLATRNSGSGDDTQIKVAYGHNARDEDSAREILGLFPQAKKDYYQRFTSHNIINSAQREGSLGAMFEKWFG